LFDLDSQVVYICPFNIFVSKVDLGNPIFLKNAARRVPNVHTGVTITVQMPCFYQCVPSWCVCRCLVQPVTWWATCWRASSSWARSCGKPCSRNWLGPCPYCRLVVVGLYSTSYVQQNAMILRIKEVRFWFWFLKTITKYGHQMNILIWSEHNMLWVYYDLEGKMLHHIAGFEYFL